jgi:hypothetical protein
VSMEQEHGLLQEGSKASASRATLPPRPCLSLSEAARFASPAARGGLNTISLARRSDTKRAPAPAWHVTGHDG